MEPVRKIKSVDKKRWDETQKTLISMFHKYFSWIYSNRQRFNQEKEIKPKEGMQRQSRTGEISPVVKDVLLASISAHYGAETESHKSKEIILLGECGWANWPRLVYVSPCWAKRKSRARWWRWAGPGRTHCGHPLPLTHTALDNLPVKHHRLSGKWREQQWSSFSARFPCLCGFI